MRIYWQGFVNHQTAGAYFASLQEYLNSIAAPGTEVEVFGTVPTDRDFGRLSELRCGIQAVDAAIGAEEAPKR